MRPDSTMISDVERNNFRNNQFAKVFKNEYTVIHVLGNWPDPEIHYSLP
jgi:hypothetical protein